MKELAKGIQGELVENRRLLHQIAEIGLELPKTVEFITKKLIEYGYQPQKCGNGIVANVGKNKLGKTILLRADMDALPMREEAEVPFASDNGNMHACGHDFHTAMLLGCAKMLKTVENNIEGNIKLMFQPAEETLEGAKHMVEHGVMENPKVDVAMMLHVVAGLDLPEDGVLVALGEQAVTSSVDIFRIDVYGKGGHGAMPQDTIDPINIAVHIYEALQILNSREVEAKQNFVLTIGELKCGSAFNIIPDYGFLKGTLRTYHPETREFVKKRMVEIAEQTAKAFRGKAKVEFITEGPSVINEPKFRADALRYLKEVLEDDVKDGKTYVGGNFEKMTGSEDFGFITDQVPGLLLGFVTGTQKNGYNFPLHHPKALFNEKDMWKGALAYCQVAMRWLEDQQQNL